MQKPEEYAQLIVWRYLGKPAPMFGEKEQNLVRNIADAIKSFNHHSIPELSDSLKDDFEKETGINKEGINEWMDEYYDETTTKYIDWLEMKVSEKEKG